MAGPGSEHPTDKALVRQPWFRSDRPVPRRVLRPLQSFLETEAASGILLLLGAAAALLWANSPWQSSYVSVWNTPLSVRLGNWDISGDLRHWVNDGLMALFFLVVGLEIKRELVTGELRDPRAAVLPIIAAVGGMVVPALIYLALNAGSEGSRGWGIPMATDIAFAVGILTIAARHAPPSLKPFLLTLAIVDDIGAILVIALFYSGSISWGPLIIAGALFAAIAALQQINVRASAAYISLGVMIWVAVFESGVHPALAGVALGLLTPAVPFQRPRTVSEEARRIADETVDDPVPPDADAHYWLHLTWLSREAVSPLARVETLLHPWTSFVIVPLFALGNAGVPLSGNAVGEALGNPITIGIVAGLVVGKTLGITLASTVGVRTGLVRLPVGMTYRHVVGVGAVAGIGFTVSIFIAELAFIDPAQIDAARIGVLAASLLAGLIGFLVFASARRAAPSAPRRNRARRSTER